MRSLFDNLHTPSSLSPLSGEAPSRAVQGSGWFWFCVCVVAGVLQAASLAWPFEAWAPPGWAAGEPIGILQTASLVLLVLALRHVHRVRQGVWRAWVFATSWLAGTFWWLFVSMHTYGGLPAWMAALAVLALAGFLATYYALAAGLLCRLAPRSRAFQALLFAALWTLAELMRGRWLTGFPWGAGGYAQVDWMAGFAPWVGVYGMGALSAWLAYTLAASVPALWRVLTQRKRTASAIGQAVHGMTQPAGDSAGALAVQSVAVLFLLASLWLGPVWHQAGLSQTRSAGQLPVWLLQGNVSQDQKFEPGTGVALAMTWYPQQVASATLAAQQGGAGAPRLVVGPETAIPLLPQQMDASFLSALLQTVAQAETDTERQVGVLLGLPLGSFEAGYTNSAWGMSPQAAAQGHPDDFYKYHKHHLVPFGEFIPPFFRWFTELMRIPLGDFRRGELGQRPWVWAGQRIAPNICYEDLFGEELAASFVDVAHAPTLLVNLSNIGWFGDTVAIDQHLQISRLRALELGRPMLRATNTGATAVINHQGVVTHQLPRLTRGRLEATVEGREGLTPYARWAASWGLAPVWGVCLSVLLLAVLRQRRRNSRPLSGR